VYVNTKLIPVETVPGIRGVVIRESGDKGEWWWG
jgi:hypothetical protein